MDLGIKNELLNLQEVGNLWYCYLPLTALELGGLVRSKQELRSINFSFNKSDSKRQKEKEKNGIFRGEQGQEKIISCASFVFTFLRVKSSFYTFTESLLLVSNLMLLNTMTNLKSEQKDSEERDKKKKG